MATSDWPLERAMRWAAFRRGMDSRWNGLGLDENPWRNSPGQHVNRGLWDRGWHFQDQLEHPQAGTSEMLQAVRRAGRFLRTRDEDG